MITPSELVSLAVRGTTQQSAQGYHHTADAILRLSGIHSLKARGGFIPPCDMNKNIISCTANTSGSYIHQKKLGHLKLILSEHPYMLEEWLTTICETGQILPDEYIPYLLELGCKQKHLRKWLKLLMSDTALWLLNQYDINNWSWYLSCEVISVDDVIKEQLKENRPAIYQISVSLAAEGLHSGNRGLSRLRDFVPMWTAQIATLLIKVMFISNVTASYDENSLLVVVVRKAAYRLPLSFADEFLSELRSGVTQWQQLADELELIFTLRQEMLESIRGSAE